MNKKIIAILLVFTLVITCFVACKRHNYETTNVNGVDLLLYTDEDGNTVINEKNQIIAVVTDEEGEIITYENGEEQTHLVQISGSYIGNGYIQDKDHKLVIPEGWEGSEDGKIIKKETEKKCYIQFLHIKTFEENEIVDDYFATIDSQNETLTEGFKEYGIDYQVEKEATTVGKYSGWHYTYKATDKDGKVIHYAENFYFSVAKTLYSVNYACVDGIGYDETFNFESYVIENFTFKG